MHAAKGFYRLEMSPPSTGEINVSKLTVPNHRYKNIPLLKK